MGLLHALARLCCCARASSDAEIELEHAAPLLPPSISAPATWKSLLIRPRAHRPVTAQPPRKPSIPFPAPRPHAPPHAASRPAPPPARQATTVPTTKTRPSRTDAPADDETRYTSLRQRAMAERERMRAARAASREAHARGERRRAKELSEEGKAYRRDMKRLHAQASEWIFETKNINRGPGEVDLHGQYVKEAVKYTEGALEDARQRGLPQLKLIVGKGLHSQDGDTKLMPAIKAFVQEQKLPVDLDPKNGGVLVVKIDQSL